MRNAFAISKGEKAYVAALTLGQLGGLSTNPRHLRFLRRYVLPYASAKNPTPASRILVVLPGSLLESAPPQVKGILNGLFEEDNPTFWESSPWASNPEYQLDPTVIDDVLGPELDQGEGRNSWEPPENLL